MGDGKDGDAEDQVEVMTMVMVMIVKTSCVDDEEYSTEGFQGVSAAWLSDARGPR